MAVSVWVLLVCLVPVPPQDTESSSSATEQRSGNDHQVADDDDAIVELLQRATQDVHAEAFPEEVAGRVVVYGEDGAVIAVHDHPGEQRIRPFLRRYSWSQQVANRVPNVFIALAVAGILFLGYSFLDANTRGQFTWSLRFTCLLVFVGICVIAAAFGGLW